MEELLLLKINDHFVDIFLLFTVEIIGKANQ